MTTRNLCEMINDREIGVPWSNNFYHQLKTGKFCQKDIRGHFGCVNSVEFDKNEELLASGGDDTRIVVWHVDDLIRQKTPKPCKIMKTQHSSNVFTTEFSLDSERIFSGGRDEKWISHDVETGETRYVDHIRNQYGGEIYRIKQCPTDNFLTVTSREKSVSTTDTRCYDSTVVASKCFNNRSQVFHNAEFHPVVAYMLLVCSDKQGPLIYDLRNNKKPLMDRTSFATKLVDQKIEQNVVCASWNPSGTAIVGLYAGSYPRYYNLVTKKCMIAESDQYFNRKTMKSMTFFDDETFATGSDGFEINVWKVEDENVEELNDNDEMNDETGKTTVFDVKKISKPYRVLKGHRSIPNQIRYSEKNNLIVSSGVEKIIKIWSNYQLPYSYDKPFERRKRHEYVNLEEELQREKNERLEYEQSLEKEELEGRATWENIFGGDEKTSESRETCEMFDPTTWEEYFRRFAPNSDDYGFNRYPYTDVEQFSDSYHDDNDDVEDVSDFYDGDNDDVEDVSDFYDGDNDDVENVSDYYDEDNDDVEDVSEFYDGDNEDVEDVSDFYDGDNDDVDDVSDYDGGDNDNVDDAVNHDIDVSISLENDVEVDIDFHD